MSTATTTAGCVETVNVHPALELPRAAGRIRISIFGWRLLSAGTEDFNLVAVPDGSTQDGILEFQLISVREK